MGLYDAFKKALETVGIARSTDITSRIPKPILQHNDGTLIVYQRFFEMTVKGYGFYTSKRFEGVGAGDDIDIYMSNPEGSGRDVYLVIIDIISTQAVYADFYHDNTVDSKGTELPVYNLNFRSTVKSVFYVEYGGIYTLGTLVHQMMVPSGRGVRAVGGATEIGEAVIVPPDHNFVLRIHNASNSSADTVFRMIWWEEEVGS